MPQLTVHFIVHEDFSQIYTALDSLYANTKVPFQVYLTVNAGSPSEVNKLRQKYPHLTISVNDHSQGFAANHNAILRLVDTPYVALLNDDVFVHPRALDTLVDYLESHPDVGLVSPAIQNPDGTQHLSALSDPSLFRVLYIISGLSSLTRHGGWVRTLLQKLGIAQKLGIESLKTEQVTRNVPVVIGVSMVVRQAAYLQAGMMDEATIVYGEESGWQWRLRQCGWKVALVTEAQITHYNADQVPRGWKIIEHRKGMLNYFLNYRPRWQGNLIRVAIVYFHFLRAVGCNALSPKDAVHHWRTVKMATTWKAVKSAPLVTGEGDRRC